MGWDCWQERAGREYCNKKMYKSRKNENFDFAPSQETQI